jgi:hypothetical protein
VVQVLVPGNENLEKEYCSTTEQYKLQALVLYSMTRRKKKIYYEYVDCVRNTGALEGSA